MKFSLKSLDCKKESRFGARMRFKTSHVCMVLILAALANVVWAELAWADPNDYNPCGQYNDYMGNLCQYDKETEKVYPDGSPLSCSDCNKPDVALNAKTKFEPSATGSGKSGPGGSGTAEGTD